MGGTLKDKITNYIGLAIVILAAVKAYVESVNGGIDYFQLAVAVGAAVIAWFTGKDSQGKPKVQ